MTRKVVPTKPPRDEERTWPIDLHVDGDESNWGDDPHMLLEIERRAMWGADPALILELKEQAEGYNALGHPIQ